jgi:hypothetical protein
MSQVTRYRTIDPAVSAGIPGSGAGPGIGRIVTVADRPCEAGSPVRTCAVPSISADTTNIGGAGGGAVDTAIVNRPPPPGRPAPSLGSVVG